MYSLILKIAGKKFDFFNSFSLNLDFNSIASTFAFEGLTYTDDQKALFKPLTYNEAKIYFDNDLLLTGTILNTNTSIESQVSLASLSGYSKPGILEDCEIPTELYPLQSDKLTLKEIIEKLIKQFGIKLIIDSEVQSLVSKKYDKSTADADQKIKDYINELTNQRNIILSHTNEGNLLLTKTKANQKPIAYYNESMPSTSIALSVNGQGIHSKIIVQKQSSLDTDVAGEETVINSLLTAYRPTVQKQTSGDNSDTKNAANKVIAAEMRNISLIINTDNWLWNDGINQQMIKPNMIIEVQSPSNFINKRTKFFVEKVTYTGDNSGIKATLNCVLPQCYSGEKFINIFE